MADTYKVFLVDKWGHVLERDGTFYRNDSGHQHFEQHFDDMDAARRFAENLVRELPHVECDIFFQDKMVLHHFDAEHRRRDEEKTRQMFADQRRRDRLVLSVIVALVALILTGVLFVWLR